MTDFKVGDIVNVVTLNDLPDEDKNWAFLADLSTGVDYSICDVNRFGVRIDGKKFWHLRERFIKKDISNISQIGEQC